MAYSEKVIAENAVVESYDNAFYKVRSGDGLQDVNYLRGFQVTQGTRVGDEGRLVYRSTPSSGLPYFIKKSE
jgi:hypothetical protein